MNSDPNKKVKLKIKHDGNISIAVGRSRKETNWKNKDMLWSAMVDRLSRTNRTGETFAEYKKLSKSQQGQIKDVGGFVGGTLKSGRRKSENVAWRHLITLDIDYAKGDFWASVTVILGCACVLYSTHAHCPEAPRLRLVIPLKRPIAPDEYPAVARRIAADLGIDFFDDTTYDPVRLMYWPSTSADGEFVFKYLDEPWLDPDEVLARYEDWRDPSYWPESSRAQQARQKLADRQGDPLEKPGVVGAFCRTYSIPEAIETFLIDIYGPAGEGRYTYLPGSTTGGLVLYDGDKFAFSHHGTDPISGRLVNSFDLVRLHKYGDQDESAEPGTPTVKLPSYLAMTDFAIEDPNVKSTMGKDILVRAQEDFADDDDWTQHLEYTKKKELKTSLKNLVLILRHDPNLKGIAYNAHKGAITLLEKVPWRKPGDWKGPNWSDDDDAALRVYLEKVYEIWTPSKLNDALTAVSHERSFHPIRDYLNGLDEWDGIPRLEEVLIDYLGAEDSVYTRAVTKKTFVAAVARVMNPGCKFDYMLVLIGKQGLGKSTLFTRLAGNWFNDSLSMSDMRDKTAAEKLQGYWILEIGELAGFKKAEVEVVKSFLSRQKDIYRPSYGRRTIEYPRQCVIVGSTNNDTGFLRDSTGNRRFWPVNVTGVSTDRAPWAMNDYTVGQIWAEALACYKAGETLYLEGKAAEEAFEQQKLAMEADERLGMVKEYLDMLLPENWEEMSLTERRTFINGGDFGHGPEGTMQRDKICVAEIWCELMGKELTGIKRFEIDEIHGLMRQIDGWEKYTGNKDGKMKFNLYGVQRAYIRKDSAKFSETKNE
ncbi:virulence-associated E family protein [Desulforamulus reducens MI-1]|uniref:Virulence-associated E family protein n=1 Tax=Desulforamulus reducens (strain ATCC BAA-1160 / DSM 100696 / MI-1) TaxID=349161 RepID=A4J3S7_DESRM|nr:virulence-associated E family protein [Desulforamulus reducens]ABO49730.1 virulence-associated E family protein [Desulforamulus reducens MI-1]